MNFFSSFKRLSLVSVLLVALLIGFGGCTKKPEKKEVSKKISLLDDEGNELVLEKPVERVVSLSPSNTEIVFALGAQDKLVGVTTYCDYPEEAKEKEKVGDFANPNVEKIISLKPEVVLATGGVQKGVVERLEKVGIKVFVVDPKNFEQLFKDIENVGEILGLKNEAQELVKRMRGKVSEVEEKVKDLPKPKVFFEIYSQPLMTAGEKTFINDMINICGGVNIGAKAGEGYPQYGEEKLFEENPDVYIAVKGSMNNPAEIEKRAGYKELKAVKEGKVYVVDDNLVTRPGPRLVDGLMEVARAIHPEAFE
jgi:iron complex transport system substrate-binding protein